MRHRPISISATVQVALNHAVAEVGDAIANLNFLGPQLPSKALCHWWRKCSDRLINGTKIVFTCGLAFLAFCLTLVKWQSLHRRRGQYRANIEPSRTVIKRRAPRVTNPSCHQNAAATSGRIGAGSQRSNAVLASPPPAESVPTFKPAEILAVATTTIHQPHPRPATINNLVQTLELLARVEPEAQEGGVQSEGNPWADQGCRHNGVEATFGPPSGSRTASPEPESSVSDDNANVGEATLIPLPGSPHPSVDPIASSSRDLNRESRTYQLVANLYSQHAAARAMQREQANVDEPTLVPLPGSPYPPAESVASSSRDLNRESQTYQLVADLYQQHAAAPGTTSRRQGAAKEDEAELIQKEADRYKSLAPTVKFSPSSTASKHQKSR
ncbi:hypothetical protein FRC01_001879 [Tulasnella sp. 417]|nr:hypothetical protein FRC01_001879 [Tulasnella sp. 417]